MSQTISTSILIHLLFASLLFSSCEGKSKPHDDDTNATQASTSVGLSKKITCMIQDDDGTYWFGSSDEGIYRYDGKSLIQLSTKDGLCSDFVQTIQEDKSGNLWIETSNGICKYNGNGFTDYTDTIKQAPQSNVAPEKGSLFFSSNGLVYHWNGKTFSNLIIHPKAYQPEPTNLDRPYGIYCATEDNKGNFWFGTDQKGVCSYDGRSIKYFTGKGLNGAAVRTIFQDNSGNIWFGNNGHGLFCYNCKSLTNFTEEHGLDNPHFLRKANSVNKSKNLARVWTINQDNHGKIWMGTIDAGVWSYDGKHLTNYTVKDGLGSNAIQNIYKDKQGELWFITEGQGIYKFNGTEFTSFIVK